jgi:Xaa-Pro aminopeptidase
VRERDLTGVFMDAMATRGVTTPATQDVARITSAGGSRAAAGDAVVEAGDLVAVDAGVVADGSTGAVGRTWPVELEGSAAVGDGAAARRPAGGVA